MLTKLGREDEARDAAWAEYRKSPSKFSFDDLMKVVPKAERAFAMGAGAAAIVRAIPTTERLAFGAPLAETYVTNHVTRTDLCTSELSLTH